MRSPERNLDEIRRDERKIGKKEMKREMRLDRLRKRRNVSKTLTNE